MIAFRFQTTELKAKALLDSLRADRYCVIEIDNTGEYENLTRGNPVTVQTENSSLVLLAWVRMIEPITKSSGQQMLNLSLGQPLNTPKAT